ncbi:MAG: hypothetical protein ACOZNI_24510 [Myxococcota bacterium]
MPAAPATRSDPAERPSPSTPPRGSPAAVLALAAALLLGFYAAVHVHLAPDRPEQAPGVVSTPIEPVKLFVYFVDGLRPKNVVPATLPTLAALKEQGLYAEVEPCYDRLTVPCMREALTGTESAGLLGAWENLVSGGGRAESNLLADVAATGRTIGVVHHGELAAFSRWMTEDYRGKQRREALARFLARGYDLVLYHHVDFDETLHKHKVGSRRYNEALATLERESAEVLPSLPPEYRTVVIGDHGHTRSGRHILGLDVPTVLIAQPGLFDPAPFPDRVPITTYRYLLGAWLGILPPPQYEGLDLARRLPEGSALRADAEARTYRGAPRRPAGLPVWGVGIAGLLGALAVAALPVAHRLLGTAGVLLAAASGAMYPSWIPLVHYSKRSKYFEESLLLAVALLAFAGLRLGRSRALAAGALALPFLLLPGTLYNYGLFQSLPGLLVVATVLFAVPVRARTAGKGSAAALLFATSVGAWAIADVNPKNFVLASYRTLEDLWPLASVPAWAAIAAAWEEGTPRRRVGAGVLAAVGASGLVPVEGYALAPLTVAAAIAWFRPAMLPVALAWVSVPYWGEGGAMGVAICVAMMIAIARMAAPDAELRDGFVPAVAAVLVYLTFGLTAGLRTNGLDFNFAVAWFPTGGWGERLWWIVGIATLVKVLTPGLLVARVAERFGAVPDLRAGATPLVLLRLAAGAAFLAGMLAATDEPAQARLLELVEDGIAWWLALAVLIASYSISHLTSSTRSST